MREARRKLAEWEEQALDLSSDALFMVVVFKCVVDVREWAGVRLLIRSSSLSCSFSLEIDIGLCSSLPHAVPLHTHFLFLYISTLHHSWQIHIYSGSMPPLSLLLHVHCYPEYHCTLPIPFSFLPFWPFFFIISLFYTSLHRFILWPIFCLSGFFFCVQGGNAREGSIDVCFLFFLFLFYFFPAHRGMKTLSLASLSRLIQWGIRL